MWSIRIPNVRVIESAEDNTRKFRELNFWREEEEDETLVCIYFPTREISRSQPPRSYGRAKVHEENTSIRPVLSMPGSSYYKIANQIGYQL